MPKHVFYDKNKKVTKAQTYKPQNKIKNLKTELINLVIGVYVKFSKCNKSTIIKRTVGGWSFRKLPSPLFTRATV